jgi:hypothetical protein
MVGAGYRRALVDPKRSLAERRLLESDNEMGLPEIVWVKMA